VGNIALLEQFDRFAGMRNTLRSMGDAIDEWAGIPMPLEGERLTIEPRYPKAQELMAICGQKKEEEPGGHKVRNVFWSDKLRSDIVVGELPDGKVAWGIKPGVHHLDMDLHTLGCADAWGIEQERRALNLLAGLIRHHQFKQYLLTGMFLEKSARTGIMYLFRRLKPTVAIRADGEECRILCTLCMHPIGYYQSTWAGAMCPSDDVVAHLQLMRAEEPMYWRRANQHAPYRPEAGL